MIMRIGETIILNDKITQKCCGNCKHREPCLWAKCELLQITTGFLNHACTGYEMVEHERKEVIKWSSPWEIRTAAAGEARENGSHHV